MNKQYIFFYLGISCWLLALVAWSFHSPLLTLIIACLTFGAFILQCLQPQIYNMFKKNKKLHEKSSSLTISGPALLPSEKQSSHTVIARDICVEGNLTSSGQIEIYGKVKGDIHVAKGKIRIMCGGRVEGNITCEELYVDGSVIGECTGDIIDVDEHGDINGVLIYQSLSIKHGATVIGMLNNVPQSENLASRLEKDNVYDSQAIEVKTT